MLRRSWQSAMIALARSARMKRFMQQSRAGSILAQRYVAGADAAAGLQRAQALYAESQLRSSLFFLGEYVCSADAVADNLARKLEIAALLGGTTLDVHVSADPTQIGLMLSQPQALHNARQIARAIAQAAGSRPGFHALMLDMEDQSVTDATLTMHRLLAAEGLPMALTVQAYLHRTEADLQQLIRNAARVRLVKGAFAAGANVAYVGQAAIKQNYRRLMRLMFAPTARQAGFYPVIATHDSALHTEAIALAQAHGWRADQWECEMLLGVRTDAARALAARGVRVRLYVPFGRDWWPHAVRRIGEHPRNALLLARSLLSSA